jgi:hypothetical protein
MNNPVEYLINNQQIELTNNSNLFKLQFNHPIKELIWFSCLVDYKIFENKRQYCNFTIGKKKVEIKSIIRKTLNCINMNYEDYKLANTI